MNLITKQVANTLKSYPFGVQRAQGLEATVVVRYYNPTGPGHWLITEAEEDQDDWVLYGYCSLGYGYEYGPVLASELAMLWREFGVIIQRDDQLPHYAKVCEFITEQDLM